MSNKAIVVKITNVEKHPNADKLQIVKLFGTQIVVGLDTKIGDVLVYVDSNMRMSEDFLKENNLFRHAEMNNDKTKTGFFEDNGRVKCIKLRGEISDGFLFPLSYFHYIGVNVPEDSAIGYEFDEVNDIKVCEKYIPRNTKTPGAPGSKNNRLTKKVDVPMFKEHFDTGQFMREKHIIPAGTICYIEEKIHGTSHRTGFVKYPVFDELPWYKKLLSKLAGITERFEWVYINGTRRVIHSPRKVNKYYHDNTMREEVLDAVRGLLLKGEEIYLELFGHEKTGAEIQKGFPYGTGPKAKQPYRTLLYRVTMNNEDGVVVDYNREAVYEKAKELGFEAPYLFEKYYHDGSEESLNTLEAKAIAYAQGQSEIANDTLKEGVVIWFINASGKWTALKYKSDAFRLKESGDKDKGIVDQEDIN